MNGWQITLAVSGGVVFVALLVATSYFKRKLRQADTELRALWAEWWHRRGDEELSAMQDEDE
jgi:hypothetical protein